MTRDELLALIADLRRRESESSAIEVKSAHRGTPKHLFEPLSALANRTGGGVLLFGLNEADEYRIVGVGDAGRLQEDISGVAADMEPAVRPEFVVEEIEGKLVVAAEVPEVPPQQRPCYYRPSGLQKGSFIRVGNSNRLMTGYEIFGYVSGRGQPMFDEEAVSGATLEDLDAGKLEGYLSALRQSHPNASYLEQPPVQVLQQVRIAREHQGVVRPTLAGLLVFGRNPQRFEPQLVITYVQYYGTTEDEKTPRGERFLDNRKFEGALPELVEAAVRHVMVSVRKGSLIEGIYRRDIPEYPEEAVREAVVNAVAHRDYSYDVRGSYIQIRLFADRLEVQSPGGLHGNVTEETLETEHSTRNRILMRLLEDLRIAENRGSGISAMIGACRDANLEPPRFHDKRSSFWVTFRNHSLMSRDAIVWLNQFAMQPLNDRQRVALAYLRSNRAITNPVYRQLNRVDPLTATKELQELAKMGLVEQHEVKRWAHYVLNPAAVLPPGVEAQTDDARIVTYVRQYTSISNAQCRELLGLRRRQAHSVLKKAVEKGLLVRVGEKRGARYVLPPAPAAGA